MPVRKKVPDLSPEVIAGQRFFDPDIGSRLKTSNPCIGIVWWDQKEHRQMRKMRQGFQSGTGVHTLAQRSLLPVDNDQVDRMLFQNGEHLRRGRYREKMINVGKALP